MKKIILMMTLFLLSFSYSFSKPVYYTGKLYINSKIIEGTTPSVNFTIEDMEIGFPGGGNNLSGNYFELDDKLTNGFITLDNVKIYSGTHLVQGNRVFYERLDGKPMFNKDRIKISITGRLIFNWRAPEATLNKELVLGKVIFKSTHTDDVTINFGEYIENAIISKIQLQVVRDLHLGFGVAGEVFDSEVGKGQSVNANPAEISIKCDSRTREKDEPEIELSIPRKVIIKNERGNTKEVTLRFRKNVSGAVIKEEEIDDGEIELEITPTQDNINVFIDGRMATSPQDEDGVYTGTFVLRAEYDKD